MSLAQIRTEIKNLLEEIPGIGKVHDFERWTVEWKKFLEFFKTADNKINGWVITRPEVYEREQAAGRTNICTHLFSIRGYYGVKDDMESEKEFQELIEAIRSALRTHNDLNGACLKSTPPRGVCLESATICRDFNAPVQVRVPGG